MNVILWSLFSVEQTKQNKTKKEKGNSDNHRKYKKLLSGHFDKIVQKEYQESLPQVYTVLDKGKYFRYLIPK